MVKYLLKRLGQTLIIVVIVSIATFFMTNLMPGDVVLNVAGKDNLSEEEYQRIYYELNLDKSDTERFLIWARNALKLDFGKSYIYNKPVWELIKAKIPLTLYLAILSTLLSVPIGVVFGVICAVKRKTKADTVITLLANLCHCLPQFWIGVILTYFFCVRAHLLPSGRFGWPSQVGLAMHIKQIILPTICMSLGGIAGFTRQTRSAMLEVIRQDYIRTARSKGLSQKKVYFKHMMRNGLIPIVTILGARLSHMLGGSMIIENVFNIPGMGSFARTAIVSKDVPVIQAVVLITTLFTCLAFLLTDFTYVLVDPRISLTESEE